MSDGSDIVEKEINARKYKELSSLIGYTVLLKESTSTLYEAIVVRVIDKAAQYEIDGKLEWRQFVNGPSIHSVLGRSEKSEKDEYERLKRKFEVVK